MNFEKTARSFNMHFGKNCEAMCFCGMSIPLLSGMTTSLSASLSAGGCIASARRTDGRFTAEFDDNQKYITSNVSEIMYHKAEPMPEFLKRAEMCGVTLGGADVLFEYNTGIYNEYKPLLLSSLYLFCPKTVPPEQLKICLSNPITDFAGIIGRRETVLFERNGKCFYVKFSDQIAKIVLCCMNEKNPIGPSEDTAVETAVSSLLAGDYVRFGKIITAETGRKIDKAGKGTKRLFDLAVKLKDGLGYGILENGGIFAIVENKKVNGFVQNIKTEYENYYGKSPEFYITRTENSGINATVYKKDL